MVNIRIDFGKRAGVIKPMHGVNNGPLTELMLIDATPQFKEAGIPFSRLHDTEYPYGSGEFVDLHCLFPLFHADENDPANYNFTLTDAYLKAIQNSGAKIIYRLGASIEHQPIKRHVIPPQDPEKWARIAEHIIRHYNEGWADGYHMGIEYWEIWNEPELPMCWYGEKQAFCEFFRTVLIHLKKCFPHLKIGGPALCSMLNTEWLQSIFDTLTREPRAELDFFSWHRYCYDPADLAKEAAMAREWMDRYGYTNALSILDEWNFVRSWSDIEGTYEEQRTLRGMAFIAACMITLQNTSTDIAAFYDAQMVMRYAWNYLFEPVSSGEHGMGMTVKTKPAFQSFLAFNKLYQMGACCPASADDPRIYALAAEKDGTTLLMLSNYHPDKEDNEDREIRLPRVAANVEVYGGEETSAQVGPAKVFALPANHIAVVTFEE